MRASMPKFYFVNVCSSIPLFLFRFLLFRSLFRDVSQVCADRIGGAVLNGLRNSLNLLHGRVETLSHAVQGLSSEISSSVKLLSSEVQQHATNALNVASEVCRVADSVASIEAIQRKMESAALLGTDEAKRATSEYNAVISSNAAVTASIADLKDALVAACVTAPVTPMPQASGQPRASENAGFCRSSSADSSASDAPPAVPPITIVEQLSTPTEVYRMRRCFIYFVHSYFYFEGRLLSRTKH